MTTCNRVAKKVPHAGIDEASKANRQQSYLIEAVWAFRVMHAVAAQFTLCMVWYYLHV
jgi:hypothetical protein